MNPSAVSRAVHYLQANRLDHLAVMPAVHMPTLALRLFCSAFGVFFSAYMRQWKAKDPRSPRFIGVGAFNLVARDAYRAIGTHQAIAMRPDDDIKLGKLLKKAGYRQELVLGMGMLVVEWYSSLREMIDGLMKNSFAGLEYSVAHVPRRRHRPVAAERVAVRRHLCAQGPGVDFVSSGRHCHALVHCRRQSLLHILQVGMPWRIRSPRLLFVYILWKSMLLTLWTGGISWRGTHYPLALLKSNRV